MEEEEPESPLEMPQIGAGRVIRKLSDGARKLSDGARKLSGEALKKMGSPGRKLSGADVDGLLFGDGNGGSNRYSPFAPDEHECRRGYGASLWLKLAVVLLLGATAVIFALGRYVEGVRERSGMDAVTGATTTAPSSSTTSDDAAAAEVAGSSAREGEVHARLLAEQRAVHDAGGAIQLSCKSTGAMHLAGALEPGQSCLVRCAPGCASSDWVAQHEHAVWGGGSGAYLDASLVCVAAKHATGEDGGQFRLLALAAGEPSASSFASSTMFGVRSSAHGKAGRAFTLELQQTTAEVEAARRAAAERAITDEQEVPPRALRDHLQALLADVPPASCLMRFFASAVGKMPPHEAVIADFQRLDAMHPAHPGGRGYLTAVLVETALRKAVANSPGGGGSSGDGTAHSTARWVELERAAFTAMDLDDNGQLQVEEFLGGFAAFERALNTVMVAADNDPKDRRISRKELRAMVREQVQPTMLVFYERVSHAPRLQGHAEELRR